MLDCKHNAELLSQSYDRPITLRERMAMRMHLMMCKGCRNFEKQLAFIRKVARELPRKL
ncbi:MAG: zf-HC2 domain-containing protein [Nitrosomonadales bacterium]|nr:zf-HC2 domain-containing protein [Nitrosomonadales bacterium]